MAALPTHVTLRSDASIDLHMHTTYSDGRWPAPQLIDFLADEGFDLVAVTDHDRVDKIAEIQELGMQRNLPVLSAVEMSTNWNGPVGQGRMGDMLCYGFDVERNELSTLTEKLVRDQLENTYKVYEYLLSKGYDFPRQDEILAANDGKLRRPSDNIKLLREHGHIKSWDEGMRLITEGGYVSVRIDMGETVEAVHKSGGVCLIAHPGRNERNFTFYTPEMLDQVRAEIPIDGIELLHPTHNTEMREVYRQYIERNDLLCSTGSDSHSHPGRMPMKYKAEISRKLLERVGVVVE